MNKLEYGTRAYPKTIGSISLKQSDKNINREKSFYVSSKNGKDEATLKEDSNDLELTLELKAEEEYMLCIGPKNVSYLNNYIMPTDSDYIFRITKTA